MALQACYFTINCWLQEGAMAVSTTTTIFAAILAGSLFIPAKAHTGPISHPDTIIIVDPCDKPPQERPSYCDAK
jgi:hypothetical protein